MTELSMLYEKDYSAWAQRNAELLRSRNYAELDIEHLVEELSDMSKTERRELQSRLLTLLAHLLKSEYQYQTLSERWREFDGRSWRMTIIEQRKKIAVLLRQSPGLQSILTDTIAAAYPDAVDLAHRETRLPLKTFPTSCPYSVAQIFNDDYPMDASNTSEE